MKRVKHLFMTYRNGIIADSLRKAGMPYGVIFGLQLPQIREIAGLMESSIPNPEERAVLARELWNDREVRESRILALSLFPPELLAATEALRMLSELRTREEADMLPFLLLKNTAHIPSLIDLPGLIPSDPALEAYARIALRRFA